MAIACALATSVWGLTAYAVTILMFGYIVPVYTILVIVGWILFPLYVMLFRHAFITGIFIEVLALSYVTITPTLFGTYGWYIFERGLLDFTFIVFYLICVAFMYFAYKSYKEILVKTQ